MNDPERSEQRTADAVTPAPALFDRYELIGEGKQAALELVIDESATAGRYQAPVPKPKQLPGQTTIRGDK